MLRLTLRQLEYVTAVADCGSLSEAALRLHLSQPALSVAIARVEAEIGAALFHRRKGAALQPTAAAPEFLDKARAVLALMAEIEAPGRSGHLRLGCFQDLAPLWLPRAMARLRAALPGVSVQPVAADFARLAADLRDGRVDLAISYDLGLDGPVERQVLDQAVPHAFMPPGDPLAAQESVTLADLAERPLILFDEGLSIRHMLRLFGAAGLQPQVRHRVATIEIMRSLAAHGEGTGISYTRPAADLSYDGAPVAARPIRDRHAREPVVLVRPAGTASPAVRRAFAALGGG